MLTLFGKLFESNRGFECHVPLPVSVHKIPPIFQDFSESLEITGLAELEGDGALFRR